MSIKFGVDIREKILRNVKEAIRAFESRSDIRTKFGEPLIGYADARNPLFDMYVSKTICDHPKRIYRPGNTVVIHFVPYAPEIAEGNRGGSQPSCEWQAAFRDSMWLSMRLNAVIRETLDEEGRLSSCANIPTDWDETRCREEWSHKLAAYAAGMGQFGPAGSFRTKNGFAGRFGSIITDGQYAEAFEPLDADELEEVFARLQQQYCYKEAEGVVCGKEMIRACPAGAISDYGIDRVCCQAYCKTIDEYIPSPEVCGKCFFY